MEKGKTDREKTVIKKTDIKKTNREKRKSPDLIAGSAGSRELDRFTSEVLGIPSQVLMERAAQYTAEEILKLYRTSGKKRAGLLFLCGNGNNGGDAAAAARILSDFSNFKITVFITAEKESLKEGIKRQSSVLDSLSDDYLRVFYKGETAPEALFSERYDLIIDGLFGTGLNRSITGKYKELIDRVNSSEAGVLSIDIPSGISGDTGEIMGTAVKADVTVTFGTQKYGLVFEPGRSFAGNIVVRPGVFPGKASERLLTQNPDAASDFSIYGINPELVPYFRETLKGTNKGTFGHVLVLSGCREISGAAFLSSAAALTAGAGLVKVVTHKNNGDMIRIKLPEALLKLYGDGENILDEDDIRWADVILAGPGLGAGEKALEAVKRLVSVKDKPVIFDADALNIISSLGVLHEIGENAVLTPHMKEFERLTGISVQEAKSHRMRAVNNVKGPVLVLKDYVTVVAHTGSDIRERYVNSTGNQALSTGGSGDVLAGIIAGLAALFNSREEALRSLSENFSGVLTFTGREYKADPLFTAAVLGVFIHGRTADLYVKKHPAASMLAGDIIRCLKDHDIYSM